MTWRNNEEIMDVKQVASRLGLEEDDIYDVLELFIQTAPSDLMKLDAAFNSRNTVLTEETAHSLKGSTGTLGFLDASKMAQEIMVQASEKRMEALSRSVPQFLDRMKNLLRELQQVLDTR
jgi:HPt (histidine-containing phosphotransfer) domain-containing protein